MWIHHLSLCLLSAPFISVRCIRMYALIVSCSRTYIISMYIHIFIPCQKPIHCIQCWTEADDELAMSVCQSEINSFFSRFFHRDLPLSALNSATHSSFTFYVNREYKQTHSEVVKSAGSEWVWPDQGKLGDVRDGWEPVAV